MASDLNEAQLAQLARQSGIRTSADNAELAEECDVLVLAVKPQVMRAVCEALPRPRRAGQLVISIAAGITCASLAQWLGEDTPLVRCMPNTPALRGQGVSGLYASDRVSAQQKALAESFAQAPIGTMSAGRAPLDLIVALTASGYELALRVAAPVMCILFLETLVIGFLMKTVPQLNILSFGFPIKILAGLTALIAAIGVIAGVMHEAVIESIALMLEWARVF